SRILLLLLLTGLTCATVFGGGGYYLGKLSNSSISQNMSGDVATSPVVMPSPIPLVQSDPTAEWDTFSDPNWGFTFKYPSSVIVERKTNLSSSEGVPSDYIQVGQILSLTQFYDRTKTPFYISNSDLINTFQTDLPPIEIEDTSYRLSKLNWEDGTPSQEVPNC